MFTTTTRFFNIDNSDTGSGGAAPITEPLSGAALLATQGKLVEAGQEYSGEIPSIITEKKEETTTPAPTQTDVTSTELTQGEQATPEIPAKEEVTLPVTAPIEQPKEVVQSDWQEVLRQKQPNEVFKALGVHDSLVSLVGDLKEADPKVLTFLNAIKTGEDLKPYLEAYTTDYTKMTPEEVMRHQLRQEYPGVGDKTLDALFQDEVIDRYKLDPDKYDEAEVERGRLLLEARVMKHRNQLIESQKNFFVPKLPEPQQVVPDNTEEVRQQQEFEALKTTITNDQFIKDIVNNKYITIGEGEDKFNFPVDPNALLDNMFNSDKSKANLFFEKLEPNGTKTLVPNARKLALISAISEHGDNFLIEMGKHYKALGGKAAIAPIENASTPDNNTAVKSETPPTSRAAEMARSGVVSSGGYN